MGPDRPEALRSFNSTVDLSSTSGGNEKIQMSKRSRKRDQSHPASRPSNGDLPSEEEDEVPLAPGYDMQVAGYHTDPSWLDGVDIHNNDWMEHMGQCFDTAFGSQLFTTHPIFDVWGPKPLSADRSIYYVVRLAEHLPRRSFPDFLAWAILPDYRDPNMFPNPWVDGQRNSNRASPWLRTELYEFGGWVYLDNRDPDIFVSISVVDDDLLEFYHETEVRTWAQESFATLHRFPRSTLPVPNEPPMVPAFWRGYGYNETPPVWDP